MGDAPSAADITAAPFAFYGMVDEKSAAASRIAAFFRDRLRIDPAHRKTAAWVGRMMEYDQAPER